MAKSVIVLGKRGKVLGRGTVRTRYVKATLHDAYWAQDVYSGGECIATRTAADKAFTQNAEGWIYVGSTSRRRTTARPATWSKISASRCSRSRAPSPARAHGKLTRNLYRGRPIPGAWNHSPSNSSLAITPARAS